MRAVVNRGGGDFAMQGTGRGLQGDCVETGASEEKPFIKSAEVGVMDDRINMLADELFGGPFEHRAAAGLARRIMSMLSVATAMLLV